MLVMIFYIGLAGGIIALACSGRGYVGSYSCECEECNRHSRKLREYNDHKLRSVAIATALFGMAVLSGALILLIEAGVDIY